MNKHIIELVELSKTDKDIDSYQPQIDGADRKVSRATKRLEDAQEEFDKVTKIITDNEHKVFSYDEQLKILQEQLINNAKKSRTISTEKEMKALAIEEDIAKEKMTFANEEIERLQLINSRKIEALDVIKENVELFTSELNNVMADSNKVKKEIEKSKVNLFTKREKTIREIDQKVLSFYEKIRIWAGNTAVVPVRKQACYGCYMKINDKTYSDVIKGDEITTCPHCGRILHIEREDTEA